MKNFHEILFDKSIYEMCLLPQRSLFAAGRETGLSGSWRGLYREEFDPEMMGYLIPDADLSGLDPLTVPMPLELQGCGQIRYVNVQYPFDGRNRGEIGGEIALPNPCMLYLRDFDLDLLPEKRYILNFKGSESAFFLFLNGQFVGYSENLFLDSEFDATPFLRTGRNRLGVLSFAYCSSTWLLDQDFYRFSGLTRDVILTECDPLGLFDIDIQSDVDSAACTSHTIFTLTAPAARRVLEVRNPDGCLIWTAETAETQITADFENLRLWSAETPHLYTLTVQTFRGDALAETASLPFGFREVQIEDGILKLNGHRVIFNGVNRHEWNMNSGRTVTTADMEFDVGFLKTHNCNAVRTSHYPNHSYFYDLCDRAGLYMIDEACLESHGTQYRLSGGPVTPLPGDQDCWTHICVTKLLRMYERDKNHPAILLWSLGNESGVGSVFFHMRQALKQRCPAALVHYEQGWDRADCHGLSDVYSSMYTGAKGISAFIAGGHDDKPYILCEFAHAMGNSLGDLDAYRALLEKHPTFQGGFVWDFIDQALMVDGRLRYGGDSLETPNDRDFCCNGIIFADRALAHRSSKAYALSYSYQPLSIVVENCRINIQNNYRFRDLSHLDFRWELVLDGEIASSQVFSLDLGPGEVGEFPISPMESAKERLIRVYAVQREDEAFLPKGSIIAREEALLSPALPTAAPVPDGPSVVDGYFNIGVTAGDALYLFAKSSCSFSAAGLVSIQIRGEEFLAREPRPTVYRPVTSNDTGCAFDHTASLALALSRGLRCECEKTEYEETGNLFTITYRYKMDPLTGEGCTVTYTVDGAGRLTVKAELDALTNLPSLPQFGLHFQLPKDKEHFRYFGRGPFDNYPDRKKPYLSGIYESDCCAEFVPYIYPQECGNHEDTRWVEICGQQARLRFEAVGRNFAFKYLPNSDFEIDNAAHVEELPASPRNHLTISGFTRGVGGDDSWWSNVHEEYTLPGNREYEFQFAIVPTVK